MTENKDLEGLGGWLILVGIGVVLTPIRLMFVLISIYAPIFTDGTWEALTWPSSEQYHPLWAPLLVGETVFNVAFVLVWGYLIYLYFSKHRLFPRVYIAAILASLVFIPLDAWLASFVLIGQPIFDPETMQEFARTLVATVIWVPYMLVSKRVKATFVNPIMPQEQYTGAIQP